MPTAINPQTGETLELIDNKWVPSPGAKQPTPEEKQKQQATELQKSGKPILAYNPKTKEQMEYDPSTNKWGPVSMTTHLKQDLKRTADKYVNMDTAARVARGFSPVALGKQVAGATEALAGGAASMVEAAGAGVYGLIQGSIDAFHGKSFSEGATAATQKVGEAWHDIAGETLEPETEYGKTFARALGLIPQAIQKAGDVAYGVARKAGATPETQALIGSGTQALTTLLTLKPGMATKSMKGVWDKVGPKGTTPVQEHFAKMADAEPEAAQSLVNHMTDKELKADMQKRLDSITMNKDKLAQALDPKNYKVGKNKPKGITVTQKDLDEMFSPERLNKAQKEAEMAQAEAQKAKAEEASKTQQEDELWNLHERAQNSLMDKLRTTALPEGPWTELDTAKEMPPAEVTGVSLAFRRAMFKKQGGGIVVGGKAFAEEAPKTMDAQLLATIRDKNRRVEPKTTTDAPDGIDELKRSIAQKGITKPVTVTISTKDGRAYVTDGNTRVSAAAELGLKNVPVRLEKTDVAFTKEQLAKSRPLNELGLTADMVPEKVRTPKQEADLAELRKLLGTGDEDIVMMNSVLGPLDPATLKRTHEWLRKFPQYKSLEDGIKTDIEQIIRTVSPESLGPMAKRAAAVLGNAVASKSRLDAIVSTNSEIGRRFWMTKGVDEQMSFVDAMEKGQKLADPFLEDLRQQYAKRNEAVLKYDMAKGLDYTPVDNYMYHLWKNPEAAEHFFTQRYGAHWNNPKFIKERGWNLYREGMKAGLEPMYTNPEEIMAAREYASTLMGMRVDALEDLSRNGVAVPKREGVAQPLDTTGWRSPNGKWYWVHNDASQILHNAFDTKSLWTQPGIPGQAFRNWMALKNKTTPILLSFSAFHPLHIALGMDFGADMVRNTKELVAGTKSPMQFTADLIKDATGPGLVSRSRSGFRLVDAWKGHISEGELTEVDRASLQAMTEGGFTPLQSREWSTKARDNFTAAVRRRSGAAAWHAPFAMLEAVNAPIFEKWIPALKAANYLEDVKTALKTDPTLLGDRGRRMEAFRKLSKSVDNRFGEMNYNQLFWNRMVRDAGVASALSMGWTLGFLREYGGAGVELGKATKSTLTGTSLRETVAKGELDKAMFVGYYTASALMIGGLITYAMTGKPPQETKDYIYPKSGEKNPDGTDKRLNTMFYTREFAGLYEHIQNEGAMSGLTQFTVNKAAPMFGMAGQFLTNLDYMNKEISDPNAPAYKQLEQKLMYIMKDLDPISLEAARGAGTTKEKALAIAGFSKAPAYATESPVEGRIKHLSGYYNKHVTPFEKAQYSGEVTKLHQAYKANDSEKYMEALTNLREKYNLTSNQLAQIQKQSRTDPVVNMFKRLSVEQQVRLMKQMSQEELQKYYRSAHADARKRYLSEQK